MLWPATVTHIIDETSPFYKVSASEMLDKKFELVVILEGTIESTGQNTYAQSSYIGEEILWGRKFAPLIKYNNNMDSFEADFKKFDWSVNVKTPLCSAEVLDKKGKID